MTDKITTKSLLLSSLTALLFATLVFITIILPAEYNIDPTGIGKLSGLTQLAPDNLQKIQKSSLTVQPDQITSEDNVTLTVPAGRGIEFKFSMEKHAKLTYQWRSENGDVYHDLHGEPKGDTTGYFESYSIATVDKMEGSFTAPFSGSHGWYWKNATEKPVTINLTTSGQYQVEGLKQ